MNPKEDLLSLYRRQGYETAPVGFHLCPSLENEFKQRHGEDFDYMEYYGMPYRIIYDPGFAWNFDAKWRVSGRENIDWHKFYPNGFEREVQFDLWGTAHEKGSEACVHMTRMHHPMKNFDSLDQMKAYPWPDFENTDFSYLHDEVKSNLDLAGESGGLFCCPTHMLEPEVPWENIEAYVNACRDYK